MKNKTIRIRRTMVMTDEGMKVRDGCKTENSVRELEIPDYIFHLIQEIPHESDSDFLFSMTRKAMYSRFKRLMDKNDIDITFHDLRHLNTPKTHFLNCTNINYISLQKWNCGFYKYLSSFFIIAFETIVMQKQSAM